MKIVKFKDGRYGFRKWTLLGYRFLDLESSSILWWSRYSIYISDCKSYDLEEVKNTIHRYRLRKDIGEPI